MSTRRFVDTNVWVYAIDTAEPAKRDLAQRCLGRQTDIVVSTQVLQEFYVVATRKLAEPLTEEDAVAALHDVAAVPVVPVDRQLVLDGVALSRERQLSLWDAMIVTAARVAGCIELLTEDLRDGADFNGLRVVNPFRTPAPGQPTDA